jgi:beta-N-acetylhexosaminidase
MKQLAYLILMVLLMSCAPVRARDDWADETLRELSLRDKIAQMVHVRMPGKFINRQSNEFKKVEALVSENHIGGLALFAGNVYESAILLNELQEISKLPLLVSSDFERGAAFRIEDATSFPWTMALGAAGSEDLAYRQGLITARESRAMGIHWIFAPVVDVNNDPDNPVINIRAFGSDPADVSRLGVAFIRGAQAGGVLTTAKHFPGHGDTTIDSHINMPVLEVKRDRLENIEFVPFRRAIEAGVDAVMTAHVAVPQLTKGAKTPATLSPEILTDVLKNSLGFRGIVVTDSMEMDGIKKHYGNGEAAVKAVKAGVDVLLLPPDAVEAINAIERAVKSGEISEKRIDESVRKILEAKQRLRLHENRTTDIEIIGDIVSSPENIELADEIAARAVAVIKDEKRLLPLNPSDKRRVYGLVLTPVLDAASGSAFLDAFRERFPGAQTESANSRVPESQMADIEKAISEADIIVVATLTRLATGRNIVIPDRHSRIVKKLASLKKPVIWVCLGSPYLLRIAPEMGTMLCTFSYSENSQAAAVKALTGDFRVSGKMPVSVPGVAKIGDGLEIPPREIPARAEDKNSGAD